MTVDEILQPADVDLHLKAGDKVSAIEEVLSQVRGDKRVLNWEKLRASVLERDAPAVSQGDCGVLIAHGRTDAVDSLVVAAGRSPAGLVVPESRVSVSLIFVVGIPKAMDSEYLRLVGAIARVCRDSSLLENLLCSGDGAAFVECLSAATERL